MRLVPPLKDMNTEKSEICEADANDFAYYLVHRSPILVPMVTRNRKLNRLKKRYDMIDLPAKKIFKNFGS